MQYVFLYNLDIYIQLGSHLGYDLGPIAHIDHIVLYHSTRLPGVKPLATERILFEAFSLCDIISYFYLWGFECQDVGLNIVILFNCHSYDILDILYLNGA